ncbi:MAG: SDR family NAD(P)-dependent oxidoreductase [Thermodesulfobacteriota bacterium]|nr:SDR family NAD(P)-dependent oxidoreductase [Thermodesulfobacteriota bacterium]
MEKLDLLEQIAIVTGAGKGLGWAIAQRLAQDGANVVIAEIDQQRGEEKARAIQEMKREALAIPTDVTQWADVDNMAKRVMAKFKRIDILVNNAGILGPYHPVMEYPEDDWDRVIAVHLKGTFLCCKAVLPIMKEQRRGKVVNMASVAGKEGNANMAPYAAAKAGIIGLTKTLGKEMAPYNVRVNCISPALIETDMAKEMTPDQRALLTSKIPMGRLGKPEEVAAVVKFLASDESSFVTGQCYDISGGRSVY